MQEDVYQEDATNDGLRYGHRDDTAFADEEYRPDRASGCEYHGRDFPNVSLGTDVDVLFKFKGQSYDRCRDAFGPIHEWEFRYLGPINYSRSR